MASVDFCRYSITLSPLRKKERKRRRGNSQLWQMHAISWRCLSFNATWIYDTPDSYLLSFYASSWNFERYFFSNYNARRVLSSAQWIVNIIISWIIWQHLPDRNGNIDLNLWRIKRKEISKEYIYEYKYKVRHLLACVNSVWNNVVPVIKSW